MCVGLEGGVAQQFDGAPHMVGFGPGPHAPGPLITEQQMCWPTD
jgi:hypothetical protein